MLVSDRRHSSYIKQIRNAIDLRAAIRDRRRSFKLAQSQLAQRIGVTRQWIIDIEKGKPRSEIGLALRALDALRAARDLLLPRLLSGEIAV